MSFKNLLIHSLSIVGVFKINVLIRSILFLLVYLCFNSTEYNNSNAYSIFISFHIDSFQYLQYLKEKVWKN